MFNVESAEELEAARPGGPPAAPPRSVRAAGEPRTWTRGTHRHIATGLKTSKFGVPFDEAVALYARAAG